MAARFLNINKYLCTFPHATTGFVHYVGRRKFSSIENHFKFHKNFSKNQQQLYASSIGLTLARYMSSGDDLKIGPILTDPEVIPNLAQQISEPTFQSLGLGGNSPIGLIQQAMETIHVGIGVPWWGTIVVTTVAFRTLMMPLLALGQANAAKLNNIKPELDILTQRMRDVANQQDTMKQAEASRDLQALFLKHKCHPLKSLIIPLVQIPIFVSFFLGLRRMANLPVESMQIGGLLWFQDLTIPDPYFLLPILCSASMLLTIEAGAEAGLSNPQFKNIKQVFRVMAILMIPITAKFPAAIFTYWLTSNAFSLGQMYFLRTEVVRRFFGIPKMQDHSKTGAESVGFMENFKAGYKNAQNLAVIKHSEQQKQKAFDLASKEPLKETFESNPLAQNNEQLFKKVSGKKKRRKNRQDKYTNDM
ncbi:mitochondrial inner membrane protein OXA1L-like [Dendronephthya gigantea]|uniref:mitochondrial inner membrane protein OXA1L-like n=1 Tax=Dendronephthya gigantea TaxID=151771 RepID=UPI00106C37B6|nr:mitochondrial inner membrane protein OXA1L-like [Dendronephthya gigantea]